MSQFFFCGMRWTLHSLTIFSLLAILIFNDYLVYVIQSFRWPDLPIKSRNPDETQVILFVADPQIQGYQDEPPFPIGTLSRLDADRYLSKNFGLAFMHTQPDVVVYLGDLMDEGSKATDEEYKTYFYRFLDIFSPAKNTKQIYVAGDNDIGGEFRDMRAEWKTTRFEKHFQSLVGLDKFGFIDYIKMDLQTQSHAFMTKRQLADDLKKRILSPIRVLLSHETVMPRPKPVLYPLLKRLEPQLIMSGHWHRANVFVCDDCMIDDEDHWSVHSRELNWMKDFMSINLTISPYALTEIMVPTCSYRMGETDIGYGVGVIENNGEMKYGILWLPQRYLQLYLYIIVIGMVGGLNFFYCIAPKMSRLRGRTWR